MTRINLLPPERVKERRKGVPSERNYLWLTIALPVVVLLAMGFWWFSLGSQISGKDKTLKEAEQDLKNVQDQIQALQKYETRAKEISDTQSTVLQALGGRVYWARILNNVAIFCPSNIWLTALTGTSSTGSGSVTFDGFALQCPNRDLAGFYPGVLDYHPDYRPIAGWLERMGQIEQFSRVWLSTAEPQYIDTHGGSSTATTGTETTVEDPRTYTTTGQWVIHFASTATLNMNTAAIGKTVTETPAAAPTPSTEEGGAAE